LYTKENEQFGCKANHTKSSSLLQTAKMKCFEILHPSLFLMPNYYIHNLLLVEIIMGTDLTLHSHKYNYWYAQSYRYVTALTKNFPCILLNIQKTYSRQKL